MTVFTNFHQLRLNEERLLLYNSTYSTSGNVTGVGVFSKSIKLRVTKIFDFADFEQAQRTIVAGLAATTNDAVFANYEEGTVLFLGASIQSNYNTEVTTVVYTFIVAKKEPQ